MEGNPISWISGDSDFKMPSKYKSKPQKKLNRLVTKDIKNFYKNNKNNNDINEFKPPVVVKNEDVLKPMTSQSVDNTLPVLPKKKDSRNPSNKMSDVEAEQLINLFDLDGDSSNDKNIKTDKKVPSFLTSKKKIELENVRDTFISEKISEKMKNKIKEKENKNLYNVRKEGKLKINFSKLKKIAKKNRELKEAERMKNNNKNDLSSESIEALLNPLNTLKRQSFEKQATRSMFGSEKQFVRINKRSNGNNARFAVNKKSLKPKTERESIEFLNLLKPMFDRKKRHLLRTLDGIENIAESYRTNDEPKVERNQLRLSPTPEKKPEVLDKHVSLILEMKRRALAREYSKRELEKIQNESKEVTNTLIENNK